MEKKSIVIFNVNTSPYGYDKSPMWKKRRDEYYGFVDTSNLKLEFLFNFYKNIFLEMGWKTNFKFNIERAFFKNKPIIHYLAFVLESK